MEFMDRIVPLEDPDVSKELARLFRKRGMSVHPASTVDPGSLKRTKTGIRHAIAANDGSGRTEVESDWILVAIGRRPYTTGLGLREAGVQLDEKTGKVQVGDDFETNVPGIYAIGDLIDGPMLAHKAEEDGVAFAEQLAGMKTHVNYDAVPSVIYTHPEVASVGPTEEQVKSSGRAYKVGRFPFSANGKAHGLGEATGFVKIIADAKTDELLGASLIGHDVTELLPELTLAQLWELRAEEVARNIHAHPTLSEALKEAAHGIAGHMINL